jgi:hypothetical protein
MARFSGEVPLCHGDLVRTMRGEYLHENPCIVDLTLKPKAKAGNFPYDLTEKSISLDPNSKHVIQFGFTPIACDNFI